MHGHWLLARLVREFPKAAFAMRPSCPRALKPLEGAVVSQLKTWLPKADVMRRVLPPPEFAAWLTTFPWKRRRGYATRALHLLFPHARAEGLAHIELTTDVDNVASRRVIEANGGTLVERFFKSKAYGGAESLRFRIALTNARA